MALERNRMILAKVESTYATDPTPVEGSNAILTMGLQRPVPYGGPSVSRNLDLPKLGNDHQLVTGALVEVTFDVELAGSGTAGTAPHYSPLLRACGLGETIVASTSVTYAHVSTSFESCTIYFNYDGEQQIIVGCRGNFAINMSKGEIPRISFRFIGIYADPTAVSMYDPTHTATDPFPVNDTNTTTHSVHSYSVNLSRFSYDAQNDVAYRNLPGSTVVRISDRAPGGNVLIEAPTLAQKNYFTAAKSHEGTVTEGAISIVHGSGAGYIATLSVPQSQLLPFTEPSEDKIRMFDIPFRAIPTDSGDDEFSLAFT